VNAEQVALSPESMTEAEFLAFYDAHLDAAFRYASVLCGWDRPRAEDLVQDAFIEIVRRLRSGSLGQPTEALLILTVRHRFLDRLRSSQREARRLQLVRDRQPGEASDEAPNERLNERLGEAIATLADDQRAAIVLHHLDGFPVAEVARELGRSVSATQSLLARARRNLRATLTKGHVDE
jgi:RNA polymerase sigma-70 factor, ECF subfamily